MKELKKIENLMILSIIYIVLALIITLLITSCVVSVIDKLIIQILVVFPVFSISFLLLGILGNFIYKTFRKRISIEKPYICFKCSNGSVLESIKQNSIKLNSDCFCIPKK